MPQSEYLTAPIKTDKMPPGVPYIVGNEAAERFSYYGMNSILVVFMTTMLRDSHGTLAVMSEPQANGWYHLFVSAVYGLCIMGAVLGDALIGKFRTILFLSIVYCFGHFALAIDHTRLGLAIGLSLIALGAGGIKPCVSANVGDQFGPSNQHLLTRVFSWFYFSINFGSTFSTLLIPWLLQPYTPKPGPNGAPPDAFERFLGFIHAPDVAFGTPGLLMVVATVVFWMGRKKFVHIPPSRQRFIADFFSREKYKELHSEGFVTRVVRSLNGETFRILGNLLIPVPFAATFWALWQQNFSSWVEQSKQMDRHLLGHEWLPAQIQTVNPLFILIMLPLFSYAIYPAMEKVVRLTPLRKFGMGLFVTGLAFAIIGLIQVKIDAGQKPNIIWQVAAFVVLTVGEVMVSVTHLEFAYTQAPKRLKSLVMCTYLGAVSLGNFFTSLVNGFIEKARGTACGAFFQNSDGTFRPNYYFFFVGLICVMTALFALFARHYKGRTYIQDEIGTEEKSG